MVLHPALTLQPPRRQGARERTPLAKVPRNPCAKLCRAPQVTSRPTLRGPGAARVAVARARTEAHSRRRSSLDSRAQAPNGRRQQMHKTAYLLVAAQGTHVMPPMSCRPARNASTGRTMRMRPRSRPAATRDPCLCAVVAVDAAVVTQFLATPLYTFLLWPGREATPAA